MVERSASARFAWQARGSWLRTHFTSVHPTAGAVANRLGTELRATARPGEGDARALTLGVEGARSDVTSDLFGSHAQHELAAYGEGEARTGPARLSAGARLDARALDGAGFDAVLSPRVGVVLPTAAGTWRLSAGRGLRRPPPCQPSLSTPALRVRASPQPRLPSPTPLGLQCG